MDESSEEKRETILEALKAETSKGEFILRAFKPEPTYFSKLEVDHEPTADEIEAWKQHLAFVFRVSVEKILVTVETPEQGTKP